MSWGEKKTSKISQFFTCKHKMNESNTKVPTHYWIVCLYSKNVNYYVFTPDKFFYFFRNLFNIKTIEITILLLLQKKAIQCVPTCAYSSRFITYAPSFYFFRQIIFWKNSIKSKFILITLLYFKVGQRMRQH